MRGLSILQMGNSQYGTRTVTVCPISETLCVRLRYRQVGQTIRASSDHQSKLQTTSSSNGGFSKCQ